MTNLKSQALKLSRGPRARCARSDKNDFKGRFYLQPWLKKLPLVTTDLYEQLIVDKGTIFKNCRPLVTTDRQCKK